MSKPLSWALYWMGDLVSKLMARMPDDPEWPCELLYPIYSRLMIWSSNVQGDGSGPWREP
jgi:hypothetical protein